MKYTITEFINELKKLNKDHIGCNGKTIYCHEAKSSLLFVVERGPDECDEYYRIKDFEISRWIGCNCGQGINIILEKEED